MPAVATELPPEIREFIGALPQTTAGEKSKMQTMKDFFKKMIEDKSIIFNNKHPSSFISNSGRDPKKDTKHVRLTFGKIYTK